MSRELDAKVATVLGLDVVGEGWAYPDPEERDWWYPTSDQHGCIAMQPLYVAHCMCELRANEEPDEWTPDKMLGHYPGCLEVVAFYSESIARARAMEDWIAEHNLHLRYAQAMMAGFLYTEDPLPDTDESLWWALLHATPEQRCRAFLAAMGK